MLDEANLLHIYLEELKGQVNTADARSLLGRQKYYLKERMHQDLYRLHIAKQSVIISSQTRPHLDPFRVMSNPEVN